MAISESVSGRKDALDADDVVHREVGHPEGRTDRCHYSLQSGIRSCELLAEPGYDPSGVAAIAVQRAINQSLQQR